MHAHLDDVNISVNIEMWHQRTRITNQTNERAELGELKSTEVVTDGHRRINQKQESKVPGAQIKRIKMID